HEAFEHGDRRRPVAGRLTAQERVERVELPDPSTTPWSLPSGRQSARSETRSRTDVRVLERAGDISAPNPWRGATHTCAPTSDAVESRSATTSARIAARTIPLRGVGRPVLPVTRTNPDRSGFCGVNPGLLGSFRGAGPNA